MKNIMRKSHKSIQRNTRCWPNPWRPTTDAQVSTIQFATSNAAARRHGADHIGTSSGQYPADAPIGLTNMPASALSRRRSTSTQDSDWAVAIAAPSAIVMPAIGVKKPKPTLHWTWYSMVALSNALRTASPDTKPRSRHAMPDLKSSRFG